MSKENKMGKEKSFGILDADFTLRKSIEVNLSKGLLARTLHGFYVQIKFNSVKQFNWLSFFVTKLNLFMGFIEKKILT